MFKKKAHFLGGKKQSSTLKDNLISVLELDETSGTTAFDSFGNNDFLNTDALINQDGVPDKSYLFNGVSSCLSNSSIGNEISLVNYLTIGFWIKNINDSALRVLFEYSSDYNSNQAFIAYIQNQRITFSTHSPNYVTCLSDDNPSNEFHHVFLEVNIIDGVLNLYTNATLKGTKNGVIGNFGNHNLFIGARNCSSLFFNDNLGQIGVWNRILTQEEKELIYNNGVGLAFNNW